jgi:hypothetical protein
VPVKYLKFAFGKKQKVDEVELDNLFTDLQGVLLKHPLVPKANVDALVSEWINDLLFLAGKITEEELQEAMQSFEKQGVEVTAEANSGDDKDDSDDDDDE